MQSITWIRNSNPIDRIGKNNTHSVAFWSAVEIMIVIGRKISRQLLPFFRWYARRDLCNFFPDWSRIGRDLRRGNNADRHLLIKVVQDCNQTVDRDLANLRTTNSSHLGLRDAETIPHDAVSQAQLVEKSNN